jgi:hypothetical protein
MPMKIGDWELNDRERARLAESRRELDALFERKKRTGFKNGIEALEALGDLFGSDEELEAFGRHIRQQRDEERARFGH